MARQRDGGSQDAREADRSCDGMQPQLFERHALPMLLIDPADGAVVDANDAAASFYGHPRATLRRMNVAEINTLSRHEVRAEMARAQHRDSHFFVFRHRLASGEERPVEVYVTPIDRGGRELLHSIVLDVSERDRLADEVHERLDHDALTGLPNRSLFPACVARAVERARRDDSRFAVLHIDLDRFRDVNQVGGHEAGDTILRQAAVALQSAVGDTDTVARLAGDELGAVVTGLASDAEVAALVERIRAAFQATPFRIGNRHVSQYTSIGIALFPAHGDEPGLLMRHAEAALRQAKREGGDQWVVYDPALFGSASERVLLGGDLREALANDGLQLALQPIVDMRSGRTIGAEALARWCHPERGWIQPDHFIPVAEASGQITAVGDWVLRKAVNHVVEDEAGAALSRIAVNISALQVRGSDIVAAVREVLTETGLSPERLELELTESAFIDESEQWIERLAALQGLGVGIAIDDFGTGYSSLQYLKRLPIDRIKIDKAFVHHLDSDADNRAIVATVVALAEQFALALTAEGVETAAEAKALLDLGCTDGQGYYYAAPAIVANGSGALSAGK